MSGRRQWEILGGGKSCMFRRLSLPGGADSRHPTSREAPARPMRALREGAGTGLPALLLGSKQCRRFIGRAGVSPN